MSQVIDQQVFPDAIDATGRFRKPGEPDSIVFARVKVSDREVSTLWRATLPKQPDLKLCLELSRPFMNFKEGRLQLARLLGKDPLKLKFQHSPGRCTFYPNSRELEVLTVPK